MQLPGRFVQWIMSCVTTVSYSIMINGQPTKPFPAKKGLRQGDPLSPYLFMLVMEYLTRLLKTVKKDPNFNYHPKCGKWIIVQLSFADDLLLFCRGDDISVQLLLQCFQQFSKALGLVANADKRRIQLIKSVLFSIQVYWSQVFVLPKKLIQLIERVYKTFLWTGGVEVSRKALLLWDSLCKPKATGSLNLLAIGEWNKAVICKLLWNLCKKKDRLWVQLIHVYYQKQNALWSIVSKQASLKVQKILKAKQYFEEAGYTEVDIEGISSFSIKIFLAAHRRLMTKDRLKGLGYVEDVTCSLCNSEKETMDHLFFKCTYSSRVWTLMLQWQGIQRQLMMWANELEWAGKYYKGRSITTELYKLVLAGTLYYIWQERNGRIFKGMQRLEGTLSRAIMQDVHGRGESKHMLQRRLRELNYYPSM
ncbi:PREDICTED: uncharacterized protein LOC109244163 [Nicotiana attenuata]|uniref:uncharacterized protein LOC109244163 n=1 Tax=Nicotiana attenuata TaxID=49451 RepID=UPI000904F070|nr:PREDICTED: uncharacterized protein LOC109244163 [Nicotiana attenuata]